MFSVKIATLIVKDDTWEAIMASLDGLPWVLRIFKSDYGVEATPET
ncbi:hypothetical protein [Staphylococcus lugdunensis]|nr:hypothetical protein [Staphylococcus lugdunensis]MCO7040409.1 hypothetical protein [Staphylococcus lugdunensis]